jgi:hypothetical protein
MPAAEFGSHREHGLFRVPLLSGRGARGRLGHRKREGEARATARGSILRRDGPAKGLDDGPADGQPHTHRLRSFHGCSGKHRTCAQRGSPRSGFLPGSRRRAPRGRPASAARSRWRGSRSPGRVSSHRASRSSAIGSRRFSTGLIGLPTPRLPARHLLSSHPPERPRKWSRV